MTEADLAANRETIARDADSWTTSANGVIGSFVVAAHAHATVALTDTLIATQGGRKTLAKASRSRSYLAAVADLDACQDRMLGNIRNARTQLYRRAFQLWVSVYPEGVSMGKDAEPTEARSTFVRGLVLHGMTLQTELAGRMAPVKRDLLATIEVAARQGTPLATSADMLKAWRDRSIGSLSTACRILISDSMVAVESLAGVDAVKPEFRPDAAVVPEVAR